MKELYDVLQQKPEVNRMPDMLSKEEYAKKMKEKRDGLNQFIDNELDKIKSDPQAYLNYLNKQAVFDQYTVSNTLLIMAQKPEATLIKSRAALQSEKVYTKKGEKGFTILEPADEYKREDGTMGQNYRMRTMFDVSQLQKHNITEKETLKLDELVGALSYKRSVDVVVEEQNPNGEHVLYSMEDKKIHVAKNLTPQQLLTGLATELCFAEIDPHSDNFTRKDLEFSALSSAYMLCQKYGIEAPSTEFVNDAPEYLSDLDNQEVKSYLSGFKATTDELSKKMENGLYARNVSKDKERTDVAR